MSTYYNHNAYDADSDDESYTGGGGGGLNPRGSQYPVHDACEFRDATFLRSMIFVQKGTFSDHNSNLGDNSSDDGSSDSDDSDSSSNGSSSSSDDEDDSSGTDGENDTAAAAAAAMGHQPPSTVGQSSSPPAEDKSEIKNPPAKADASNSNGKESAALAPAASENNNLSTSEKEDKEPGNGSKEEKIAGEKNDTSSVTKNEKLEFSISPEKLDDANITVQSPIQPQPQGSFSEMDISPVKFGAAIPNELSDNNMNMDLTKKLETIESSSDSVKIIPQPATDKVGGNITTNGGGTKMTEPLSVGKSDSSPSKDTAPATMSTISNTTDTKTDTTSTAPTESKKKSSKKKKKKDSTFKVIKQPEYYCPHDLNERDEDENTPLHVAIHHRKLNHIQLLLGAGADPHKKCDGSAPLHTVISIGAISSHKSFACDAVEVLQKYHADFLVRDDSQQTPLYLAVSCNLPSVVGIILNDSVGIQTLNIKSDRSGGRPLHAAAKFDIISKVGPSGGKAGIQGLSSGKSHGLNGNGLVAAGATIAAAGASSKALTTQILLNTPGIELDPKNNCGKTPLHIACSRGNWPVARLLLEAGASPATTDQRGFTPGAMAYKRGISIPNDLIQTLGPPGSGIPMSLNACIPPTRDLMIDPEGKTLIMCHELCSRHMTCPPITRDGMESNEVPPENVRRLSVLLNEDVGILRSAEFDNCVWEGESRRVAMCDVLKVHEYSYVEKISQVCSQLPDHPSAIANLDQDTAISRWSFEAAMRAAGSVCEAIDRIMAGDFRNAFCAVRPPGHHAGPRGVVRCANDPEGSHGFCLLNNVAIGAAYARSMYRHEGIKKVAIIDFDVHHGNGTEEIIRQLVPNTEKANVQMSFATGQFETSHYRPWLDETDVDNVFFASAHGYGPRDLRFADHLLPHQGGYFYPASGKSIITDALSNPSHVETPDLTEFLYSQTWTRMGEENRMNCCKVINVGLDLPKPTDVPGMQRVDLRDSYRKKILPHLLEFDPDMIFISAGFDAHRKDTMNFGYVGMVEEDYEWVTEQLIKVGNKCCNGRVISVLEGGYKIHGGIISPFARSVASHVRALADGGNSRELYDTGEAEWESQYERDAVEEREKRRLLRLQRCRPVDLGNRRRHFDVGGEEVGVMGSGEQMAAIDTDAILKEPLSQYLPDVPQGPQSENMGDGDPDGPSRKRRRNQVDYKELLEQMKQEKAIMD